jgi:hypothetical protein
MIVTTLPPCGADAPSPLPLAVARAPQTDRQGRAVIRPAFPAQHAAFYAQLQTLYVGGVDDSGQPWATVLCAADGTPGFATCPDARTLRCAAAPGADDPLAACLSRPGAALALLGLEHHTRRRNRANGRLAARLPGGGFDMRLQQAFGNCPQYIAARVFTPASPAPPAPPPEAAPAAPAPLRSGALSSDAAALVAAADTCFIATAARPDDASDPTAGCDVSHRGGRPGFVRVSADGGGGQRLEMPDFAGNGHFNTLGNLALEPRCGLLFIDWASGDVLHVAGEAAVLWDGPAVAAFAGAQRLLRVSVRAWALRRGACALRSAAGAAAVQPSPLVAATGDWARADAAAAAAAAADVGGDAWRPFVVLATRDVTPSVREFTLAPADGAALAPHTPGQHVPLRLPGAGGAERRYSVTSVPDGSGSSTLTIAVRRAGAASAHLHDACGVGAALEARRCAGRFVLDAASPRRAALLSAGGGASRRCWRRAAQRRRAHHARPGAGLAAGGAPRRRRAVRRGGGGAVRRVRHAPPAGAVAPVRRRGRAGARRGRLPARGAPRCRCAARLLRRRRRRGGHGVVRVRAAGLHARCARRAEGMRRAARAHQDGALQHRC